MPALLLISEAARIPLSMLLIFGAAKVLAELFERYGQPGIVGEILAGVLIGPSVLGWVQPNDLVKTLSEIGVMFLLFRVGLEMKASELMKVGDTAALVACCGVIVPFFLGWGVLSLWGKSQIESIFVGAAMVATSVGITAQVLAVRGLLQERASQIILAAAVIDDVLGLLVLALVSGMARGRVNLLEIGATTLMATGFVFIAARWGTQTMGRAVRRLERKLHIADAEFAIAMILLFAFSLLAVYTGVAAIVGAFLAGMALGESAGHRVHDLTRGTTELLVPFFLAGIGLHVDLSAFRDPHVLLLTGVVLLVAVVSKFIGCGLAAGRLGATDALRIGVGMIPRGEVGMVVAQFGLAMGVVSHPIYAVVVTMAVATTLVSPPLIGLAYAGAGEQEVVEEEILRLA